MNGTIAAVAHRGIWGEVIKNPDGTLAAECHIVAGPCKTIEELREKWKKTIDAELKRGGVE